MPAKPPKKPKDATQEQLEEYSQKLEQYFKDREKELADQQLQADRNLAELDREKANVQLRKREADELKERYEELEIQLSKQMKDLDMKIQSHEVVWKEESAKLDDRRVELLNERKRLEKLSIELENAKPEGGGGDDKMVEFMQQQKELLTKITSLEVKR